MRPQMADLSRSWSESQMSVALGSGAELDLSSDMRRVAHTSRSLSTGARRSRSRKAFTLLELLVVISTIGLLIGLLLPSLKRSMELAKATTCKSNLRQLGTSLYLYRLENDGWLPQSPVADVPANTGRRGQPLREPWFGQLFPTYLTDPLALRCPKDPFGFRVNSVNNRYRDPSVADFSSYGMNNFILTAGEALQLNPDRRPPKRPHDTILAADIGPDREFRAAPSRARATESDTAIVGPERNSSLLLWSDGFDPFARSRRDSWVTTRHGHGIHMVTLTNDVRDVRTTNVLDRPVQTRYDNCASGGCTFCLELELPHYSFARDRLFWWTGPLPPLQ